MTPGTGPDRRYDRYRCRTRSQRPPGLARRRRGPAPARRPPNDGPSRAPALPEPQAQSLGHDESRDGDSRVVTRRRSATSGAEAGTGQPRPDSEEPEPGPTQACMAQAGLAAVFVTRTVQ